MLEITNDITLHSKTTHDIITCTSSSLYDKRRGQASKFSNIAYTLEGTTSFILNLHCICRQAYVSNFHVKKKYVSEFPLLVLLRPYLSNNDELDVNYRLIHTRVVYSLEYLMKQHHHLKGYLSI